MSTEGLAFRATRVFSWELLRRPLPRFGTELLERGCLSQELKDPGPTEGPVTYPSDKLLIMFIL